jgi:hypothetical protein
MKWIGHVPSMEDMKNAYKILVEKPEGKITLEQLDVDGRITLKWIWRKRDWRSGLD